MKSKCTEQTIKDFNLHGIKHSYLKLNHLHLSAQDLVEVLIEGAWRAGSVRALRTDGHLLRHIKVTWTHYVSFFLFHLAFFFICI